MKPRLFDRRRSVLLIGEWWAGTWQVCLADDEGVSMRQVTKREVELLLRTWLSPVPPPAVEHLQAFA